MKSTIFVIGGLIATVGLIVGAYFLIWHSAEPRGALEARERTVADGDFRIGAYNLFYGLCTEVQAQEGRIKSLEQELNGEPAPSADRVGQIQASLTAVRSNRTEIIAKYNNSAASDFTVGQFRDNDLPSSLDPNNMETECVFAE